MRSLRLIPWLLTSLLAVSLSAQELFFYRVQVVVDAASEPRRVQSLLERELRSLGDVRVVRTDPQFLLYANEIKNRLEGDPTPTGSTLSLTIFERATEDLIALLSPDREPGALFSFVAAEGIDILSFLYRDILTGPDLVWPTRNAVSNFDPYVLADRRDEAARSPADPPLKD